MTISFSSNLHKTINLAF